MKKYIKDNKIIYEGTPIVVGDKKYYNPTEEIYLEGGWEEYTEPFYRTLDAAKEEKIKSITDYDVSNAVNGFILNGEKTWLCKADRVGLMNAVNILKADNIESTVLWYNNHRLILSCDDMIEMLSKLEEYALACYNTTEQHKADVLSLENIEDVDGFDITEGYPTQIVFNV